MKKKIQIIHTGGTLGMNLRGSPDDKNFFLQNLKQNVPQIFELADTHLEILINKDSSNMNPGDWVKIARRIHELSPTVDGFVVTHGTDTMSFTASALSFMVANLGKPVILTGSQKPLAELRSDGPRNLIHSVEIAADGKVKDVCIFFDSSLMRGNRAKKVSIPSFRAFTSPNHQPLAEVGVNIEYFPAKLPESPFRFDPRVETNVATLPLFPGINTELFTGLIDKGVKGVVLMAFGPGDIPLGEQSVIHLITSLIEKGIPTIICSQAVFGSVDLSLYETGRAAEKAGAISAKDMTWEAALVKMMILLGRGLSLEPFRLAFSKNLAGELSD